MAFTFLVIPQWQGSGSSRAMRLVDGAEAIRGDLPATSTRVVEVPLEAGEAQDSRVSRFTSLQLIRDRVAMALAQIDGPVIAIGGDCGIELAPVERATDSGEIALVWFDAHPDLNTPESSRSAAFTGMIARTLLGDGAPGLLPARPLAPSRLVLAGTRDLDDAEDSYVAANGIPMLNGDDLTPESLVAAVEATGASAVYVHIDLDVLDPSEFEGIGDPEPFGLSATRLVELIKALKSRWPLAGAGITEFAPSSPDAAVEDMPSILRIIGALAA